MVDHLKILVTDLDEVERIWNNPKLIWFSRNETLNHFDMESIKTREKRFYKGILVCKFQYKMEILFSPHYFKNNNVHNCDDFRDVDCINTLKEILKQFEVSDLTKWQVKNIEFGLNFIVPGYGKDLVTFTEYWKKTPFYNDSDLAFSKKSYRTKPSGTPNWYKVLKLYAKGVQFPMYCDTETVRLEIKSKQSKYIEKLDIKHVGHLLTPSAYQLMKKELLQVSQELVILDHNSKFNNLNVRESRKLKDYLNNHVWFVVLQKAASEFYKKKHRYYKLLKKTGFDIHDKLKDIISEKLDFLCLTENEMERFSIASNNTPMERYSSTNKGRKPLHTDIKPTKCPITGYSLHLETGTPNYIRTTTLKQLQKTKLKEFEKLRLNLIPTCGETKTPKFEKDLISRMCKQIRNRYYNSIRAQKKESINSIEISESSGPLVNKTPIINDQKESIRIAMSKEQLKRNNNLALLYLHEKRVYPQRNSPLHRAVSKLNYQNYKIEQFFYIQLKKVAEMINTDYGVDISERQLFKLVNDSRKFKGRLLYQTEEHILELKES